MDCKPNSMPLEIGWKWDTPDRWAFHRTCKDNLWNMLRDGKIDFKAMYQFLSIKESWLDIKPGYKYAPNYPMIKYIREAYMKRYRDYKPPIHYRLAINKITIFLAVLYKEDTAYTERIGGTIQYILDNSDEWIEAKDSKDDKLLLLTDVYQWWYENDWRTRTKQVIDVIFKWILDKYEHYEFIRKSVDFFIYAIIANKDKWIQIDEIYRPEHWYPRGKGSINYIVHNRRS